MPAPRLATVADAVEAAGLLHDFNVEFATPTPGVAVIGRRLTSLLGGSATFAVLAGRPAVAIALVTLRANVWFDGPVAVLDELYVRPELRGRGIGSTVMGTVESEWRARGVRYVEINVDEGDVGAQRFYERHGFSAVDPDTGERALSLSREL